MISFVVSVIVKMLSLRRRLPLCVDPDIVWTSNDDLEEISFRVRVSSFQRRSILFEVSWMRSAMSRTLSKQKETETMDDDALVESSVRTPAMELDMNTHITTVTQGSRFDFFVGVNISLDVDLCDTSRDRRGREENS